MHYFCVEQLSFTEICSKFLSELKSSLFGLDGVVLDVLDVEIIDNDSGGDHVILIDVFNKRLDAGSLDQSLLAESSFRLSQVTSNTCH